MDTWTHPERVVVHMRGAQHSGSPHLNDVSLAVFNHSVSTRVKERWTGGGHANHLQSQFGHGDSVRVLSQKGVGSASSVVGSRELD